jgi:hypothetical protein
MTFKNSMRTVADPCLQSSTSKLQAAAQAVQMNRRNSTDHHSPCADCELGTRGTGPIIAAPYLHFVQLQSKSTS